MKTNRDELRYDQLEAVIALLTEISNSIYEIRRDRLVNDLGELAERFQAALTPRPFRRTPIRFTDDDIPF